MARRSALAFLLVLLPALAAVAANSPAALELHLTERRSEPHPRLATLRVDVETRIVGPLWACAEYGNTMAEGDRGRVVVRVEVVTADGAASRRIFRGGVRGNHFAKCVELSGVLDPGDVAIFRLRFKGFSRMSANDAYVAFAGLIPK